MRVLTVNTGSSTVKLRVLDAGDDVLASADPSPGEVGPAVATLLAHHRVDAVGHRVVHGGPNHVHPTPVDDAVLDDLRAVVQLAPLHQPAALDAIDAVRRSAPGLPAVACFDTAFHAGLPEAARTYALPAAWRARHDVRRYGFHGLSYAWASRRVTSMLGRDDLRLVVAHLGSGASLAAVRGGRPVDTTMGFTPLDGLVMATRAGSVDPGLVLWLVEHGGLSAREVLQGLDRESGLLGLTGTKDMREVLAREAAGDPDAVLGLETYLHRLVGSVAAMAASLGGLDALVFTGGVGERAVELRARAVERLAFLGLRLDPSRNAGVEGDVDVTRDGAAARTLVVASREDVEIARGTRVALS
jgi:acetate kinase